MYDVAELDAFMRSGERVTSVRASKEGTRHASV